MRVLPALLAIALVAAAPATTLAEDIDAATLEALKAVATRGYDEPGRAEIRAVHKSKATNGKGYCGEVSIEDMPDAFTTFHALLEPASVLRLADFNAPETDPNSRLVHEMMQHFGCVE